MKLSSIFKFGRSSNEKLNPAQESIVDDYGEEHEPSPGLSSNQDAYDKIEVVNRGVNLIADSAAGIKFDIGEILQFSRSPNRIRHKKVNTIINFQPNDFYNADNLFRNVYMDLILEGDAFMYWDGAGLYHLPAINVTIESDKKTFIKRYKYANDSFLPNEIIHIRENSGTSIYTGKSRLDSAKNSMELLLSMHDYQKNFFDNSAIPGIVLSTPDPIPDRIKDKIVRQWIQKYNPKKGGRKPMIIDNGFKMESLSKYSFNELDFNESTKVQEEKVLKALGVPPLLIDSGNNANLTPNLKMFYLTTVMPLIDKVVQGLESYFGYDIKPITQDVMALRPELRDLGSYLTSITNAGIATRNEARQAIRLEPHDADFADDLILPANVAGSNADPSTGGRPKEDNDE